MSKVEVALAPMPGPQLHRQLHHQVADQLREAIQTGTLKPGHWLRQEHLAQELGVSQMPVREALKELIAEGLVEHLPYRGMRVREYSADDIADVYKIRALMEGMAARAAAESITAEELAELFVLATQMDKCLTPDDLTERRELNRRFHHVVFTASRRAYLVHALRQLWMIFPSMLWGSLPATATKGLSEQDAYDIEEHRAIISALKERNGAQAERAMHQHVEDAGHRLLVAFRTGTNSAPGKQP